MRRLVALLTLTLLVACAAPTPPPEPQVLTIAATAAAQPWLEEAYRCAVSLSTPDGRPLALRRVADSAAAEIALRLGEPPSLVAPAYAIGEAHLEIVVHPKNAVATLDPVQVAALFSGRVRDWEEVGGKSGEVHVWVYAEKADVQEAFRRAALRGGTVTSLARQASGPEAMREAIAGDEAAIGFLPRRWLTEDVRALTLPEDLRAALTVPVLAISPEEPQGVTRALLACLQRGGE